MTGLCQFASAAVHTGEQTRRFDRVLVPEMNLGQLSRLLRAEYLVDALSMSKVKGIPFRAAEVAERIMELV